MHTFRQYHSVADRRTDRYINIALCCRAIKRLKYIPKLSTYKKCLTHHSLTNNVLSWTCCVHLCYRHCYSAGFAASVSVRPSVRLSLCSMIL